MTDPTVGHWQRIESLLHQALALPVAEREEFLHRSCDGDGALLRDVASLLEASVAETGLLAVDQPAHVQAAAGVIVQRDLTPGTLLGSYRVVGLIGRGGMGEVYRCERADGLFQKSVAAKVLRPEAAEHLSRFESERRIVAKLDHPGIARLLDGGMVDDRPYMVMDFVEGSSLSDFAYRRSLHLEALLDLFGQVCDAVSHAHGQGVIHRDLKPGNILVTEQGRAKLLDFGIAKLTGPGSATVNTATQAPMTVAYAAPEQIAGKNPTAATDVHALGVILYELLTGRLPWRESASAPAALLMQRILHEDPPPASVLARANAQPLVPAGLISGDLDAILTRCLRKNPEDRYAAVADLASDLANYRKGEPITARKPTTKKPSAQSEAERRQLTALFCDLVGSTSLGQELDAEDYHGLIQRYHATVAEVVERYEGHVAQYLGDGVLVYFGHPVAHEDDAERALRAACEMLEALRRQNDAQPNQAALSVRIGIHTGTVIVGQVGRGGRSEVQALGDTLNLASRLQGLAEPNAVIISAATMRLVPGLFVTRDLGEQNLKGIVKPVRVFQVLQPSGVKTRLEAADHLTPFVGRAQELALLNDRWEQAQEAQGQAVLLVAEPGLGKSRMLLKFREQVKDSPHTWFDCRCSPLTRNAAFAPVAELLSRGLLFEARDGTEQRLQKLENGLAPLGRDLSEMVPLLAPLLNIPLGKTYTASPYGPELRRRKTLDLLTEWLIALSARQPLVLVVEDLHWSDPSSVDLLNLLVERISGHALLLVFSARPEFRPQWPSRTHYSVITLQPLRPKDTGQMLADLVGNRPLPKAAAERILQRAGGVPLFLEEIVRHLVDSEKLVATTAGLELRGTADTLEIPATLQDSLAARMDRLGEAKALLQVCAVIGREAPYALLRKVADLDEPTLQQQLKVLTGSQLLYPRGSGPEAVYTFKHALILDAAYGTLLKSARKQLHAAIAQGPEEMDATHSVAELLVLAQHHENAEQAEDAIRYYRRLVIRSDDILSLVQALPHIKHACSLVQTLPESPERNRLEIFFINRAIRARIPTVGFCGADNESAAERLEVLVQDLNDSVEKSIAYSQLMLIKVFDGQIGQFLRISSAALEWARHQPTALEGYMWATRGYMDIFRGEFHDVMDAYRRAGTALEHSTFLVHAWGGNQMGLMREGLQVIAAFNLGFPQTSRSQAWELLDRIREIGGAGDFLFNVGGYLCTALYFVRVSPEEQLKFSRSIFDECDRYGHLTIRETARVYVGSALCDMGRVEEGLTASREGIAYHEAQQIKVTLPGYYLVFALQLLRNGRLEEARTVRDKLFALMAAHPGIDWSLSENHRLDAELLRAEGAAATRIEAALQQALAVAQRQGNRWFELRSATVLATFWKAQGRSNEARLLLWPIYRQFTEGFDLPDLKEAQALLHALAPAAMSLRDMRRWVMHGRYLRLARLAGTAAQLMLQRLTAHLRRRFMSPAARERLDAALRAKEAAVVAQTLGNMKGVLMKLGQIVSFTADGLSPEMRTALQSLQSDAPAMDFSLVKDVIESEFGRPLSELYAKFDEQPVAAASIGQVHRAVMHSGEEVAVKVQYPGVAQAIAADLANTGPLFSMIGLLRPSFDIAALLDELRGIIALELDYVHEAKNQRVFLELYDGHPFIRIPRLYDALCGARVITSEFIRGRHLDDLTVDDEARARYGEMLVRFSFGSLLHFSVFNSDPHPGNYLFTDDGKVAFIDFGCVKFFPDAFMGNLHRQFVALFRGDVEEHREVTTGMGYWTPDSPVPEQVMFDFIAQFLEPALSKGIYTITPEFTARCMRQVLEPAGRFSIIAKHVNVPRDMLFVFRITFGLYSILAALKTRGPYGAIYRDMLLGDAAATDLGLADREYRRAWLARRSLPENVFFVFDHEGLRVRH